MRYRVARRISKHKTFLSILVSVLIAYIIFNRPEVVLTLSNLGEYRLLGAFLNGMLFSSVVTTVPALAMFYVISSTYPPILIALFGAMGAMIGDIILYRFVVSGIVDEVEHDFRFIRNLEKYRNRGIYKYIVPIIGGFIIASPLPDELGIVLIGQRKMSYGKFILYSYVFNFIGIYIVATLGSL